jgi:hypothetical protein
MNGFSIIFAEINGAAPLPFILDTGGHDILTPASARTLGLRMVGSGKSYGAGSGSTATSFTRVDSIGIGGVRLVNQPFTVLHLDLGQMDANGKTVPIAGILGLELFERFLVAIDYASNTVTLSRKTEPPPKADETVSLRFTSDMPLADASVDGVVGSFGIDSGNNVGLILFAPWASQHLPSGEFNARSSVSGESVGGSIYLRKAAPVALSLGKVLFASVQSLIARADSGSFSVRSEAGNIGTPVLRLLKRAAFDYLRDELYLDRRP